MLGFVFKLFAISSITGCGRNAGGNLNEYGTYTAGNSEFRIFESNDMLVVSAANSLCADPKNFEIGSTNSRWFSKIEGEIIYMYCGDTGIYIINGNDCPISMTIVRPENKEIIAEMPESFFDELPQSIKKRYAQYRNNK